MKTARRKHRTRNQFVGRFGEDAACAFLKAQGHTVIGRNWHGNHTEIDIISIDKDGLHFVEVKTRTADPSGAEAIRPQDKVDLHKQEHLVQAAQRYLQNLNRSIWPGNIIDGNVEIFFDVVAVILRRTSRISEIAVSDSLGRIYETISLEYIPQAFIPMYY